MYTAATNAKSVARIAISTVRSGSHLLVSPVEGIEGPNRANLRVTGES